MTKTKISNLLIGQYTDTTNITGCTVLLFPEGATGVAYRLGGAISTRNFDPLTLEGNTHPIHGMLITGGSAFGLSATNGVVEYLKELGLGIKIDNITIPIVPSCVIFDLFIGEPKAPEAENAYKAAKEAKKNIMSGSYGAGTGAVVGKLRGTAYGMKGGTGYVEETGVEGVTTGTIAIVNAFGDIIEDGRIIAGALNDQKNSFINTAKNMEFGIIRDSGDISIENTTIVVVITEAKLTKREALRVAIMASGGMADAINPVWTPYDGDMVVVLSVGNKKIDPRIIGVRARKLVKKAIIEAIKTASGLGGILSYKELLIDV